MNTTHSPSTPAINDHLPPTFLHRPAVLGRRISLATAQHYFPGLGCILQSLEAPTTILLSAQERLKAGDVLLPTIDALLKKGECVAAANTDAKDTEAMQAEKDLRLYACHAVREFPELRKNLLHWRMRENADKLAIAAGHAHGRLGWTYEAARGMDDSALSSLVGEITTIWLTDEDNDRKPIQRRYSRLAGKCNGITKTSEVASKICEAGSCRLPLRRGDLLPGTKDTVKDHVALREQLQVCVMSELPASQDFASGRLRQTDALAIAEKLRDLFADCVIGAQVVSKAPGPLKGIARLAFQP